MMKLVKIMALCLLVAAFGMIFTGCDMLDEMRANQALLSEDKETLTFRGETYKRLPDDAGIYVSSSYNEKFGNIMVTDEDVPVLLSTSFYYTSDYDAQRDIFSVFTEDNLIVDEALQSYYSYAYFYYCNLKDYDKYVAAIKNNALDYIGIEYSVSTEEDWYYTLDTLSKEASDEIMDYIKNSEKMTYETYKEISYKFFEYNDTLQGSLYKCDADGLTAQCLDDFGVTKTDKGDIYLTNFSSEKSVKLSDETAKEFKDVHFYGDYTYTSDDVYIGGADTVTDIIVV